MPPLGLPRASGCPRHWPARSTGISSSTTARRRTPASPRTGYARSLHAPWPKATAHAPGPRGAGPGPLVAGAVAAGRLSFARTLGSPVRSVPPGGPEFRCVVKGAGRRAVGVFPIRRAAGDGAPTEWAAPSLASLPQAKYPAVPCPGPLTIPAAGQPAAARPEFRKREGTAHGTSPRG